jgi:hypothetical protein
VKREDRLVVLRDLLARVQRNAAARGEPPPPPLVTTAAPPPEPRAPPPAVRRPMLPPPAPPPDEPTLEALSQRALVLMGYRTPVEIPRDEEPAWIASGVAEEGAAALAPPAPAQTFRPARSVAPPDPVAPPVATAAPIVEETPASALERAVREAAVEHSIPPGDPRALWAEAVEDLREHRSLGSEELGADPVAESLPFDVPRAADSLEVAQPMRRRPEPASQRPPPSYAPRALRGNAAVWVGGAIGAAFVVAVALAVGAFRASEATRAAKTNDGERAVAQPTGRTAPTGGSGRGPAATPSAPPTAAPSGAPTDQPLVGTPEVPPPPQAKGLAFNRGLLRVDTKADRQVFVNGVQVGRNGTWIEVDCGLKNVRTAQPGPPPAGASFPVWTSAGHPVFVPCGESTRVSLPSDP